MRRRPIRHDTTKPHPECPKCRGKGMYPPEEMGGLKVTIRLGKSKNPQPCERCHR